MNYDYAASKQYCENIGLTWLGDAYLINIDREAKALGFTQAEVDWCIRTHLYQVKFLFTPKNYPFLHRLAIAFYFLTGLKPSAKGKQNGRGSSNGA